ncbi:MULTISPECIES: ubiquinone biosynthesis accessory factor UbiK [unclassified Agarivorans]|uniref:ubiquinone biosynthesis accessory factor UbiK n=1 Tax=unclassified Agarivorans TaxID=2636026 RepID=UPI0026E2FE8A|nr:MULTISPECIES: accessory factor UbiK family protein [unclassified Agarivorans]MDO6686537.1 accessory factor UbiK family protein [Agarivorans sp. 3_MG-2023]MDO6715355.1 accessory factor UbiK family protein [Agarivorans sp. 2_MG-2023]MDO6763328.1 accessory factor UbiK family protein [Agarivorans sp. 1_MG-2023]
MINPAKIEEIAKQVSELVPPGLKNVGDEFERKVKQVVQAKLSQLDVVNREDFDVQTQVLLRTREKLTALEAKVAELEKRLNQES